MESASDRRARESNVQRVGARTEPEQKRRPAKMYGNAKKKEERSNIDEKGKVQRQSGLKKKGNPREAERKRNGEEREGNEALEDF